MLHKVAILVAMNMFFGLFSCGEEKEESKVVNFPYEGGGGKSFKIPVPKGYDWEVSQSWGTHCEMCDERYPADEVSYCESSHTDECCKFGWDFNLPGNADKGKPVLASANGVVKEVSLGDSGWGNTVVINHGDNVCSRYAHLLKVTVHEYDSICQGLKIGEIGSSGFSSGEHLHFQFENCTTGQSVEMGFSDGNGIPLCTRGDDRYDSYGKYFALKLTNSARENCESEEAFGGDETSDDGWLSASCGALLGCPMITNCGREQKHQFKDNATMGSQIRKAVMYLYGECAVDGKSDGAFHSEDLLTRAEALKIPMYLFGLTANCGSDQPFADVDIDDWFFGVVACAVRYGILEHTSNFNPHEKVTFSQALKFVTMAAKEAGVTTINPPENHSSEHQMTRGEYAVLVASMSPCFCENVACDNGCRCNQEMFACMSSSEDPGVGGENSDPEDNENLGNDDFEWEDLITIECEVDSTNSSCEGLSPLLYVKCSLENLGDRDLFVNDMVISLIEDENSSGCSVVDETLQGGVGVQTVEAGEKKNLNGHYEISCSTLPSEELEVSFDIKERLFGNTVWYYEIGTASLDPAVPGLQKCEDSDNPSGSDNPSNPDACEPFHCLVDWICLPTEPYIVKIYSLNGGTAEVLTADGEKASYAITSQANWEFNYSFPCDQLPLTVLLTSGPYGAKIGLTPLAYPPSAFYFNYSGGITPNPSMSPTNISTHEEFENPFARMLIRIPF